MKLALVLVLLGITLSAILFGKQTIREGRRNSSTKKSIGEYGGAFLIQQTLVKLISARTQIWRNRAMNGLKRRLICRRIDIVIEQLKTLMEERVRYLNLNNNFSAAPLYSGSIDKFRTIWSENVIGIETKIKGVIDELDQTDEKQLDVVIMLNDTIKNVNVELGIKPTDRDTGDNKNSYEYEDDLFDDYMPGSLSDIYDAYLCDLTDEKNLTYDEQFRR